MRFRSLVLICSLQIVSCTKSPSIVIVGAGAAGIAAAARLLENNFTNIKILEAENRIGGRIYSVFFGKAFIDLGAEWCHGKNNFVYQSVKNFDILHHQEKPTRFYLSSGKNVSQEFGQELKTIFQNVFDAVEPKDAVEGETLGDYCTKRYNSIIYKKYSKNFAKLEIAKLAIDFFQHDVLNDEGAFSWFDLSAKSDYVETEGDQNLKWNGLGFKTILNVLMKQFPNPSEQLPLNQAILLNKEVVRISLCRNCQEKGVNIVCSDNSFFTADHVIFTPSIGVLKETYRHMFLPSLPEEKNQAIRDIGFAGVLKVVLYFKNKWWKNDGDFNGFNFIWNEDDKNKIVEEFPHGPVKEGHSWLTDFYIAFNVNQNPNVLFCWFTGDMVPQIGLLSAETMTNGLTFVFKKFFGHKYNVTKPDKIKWVPWYTNTHFRGSYSFQTLRGRQYKMSLAEVLTEPIVNQCGYSILQFAGEATHRYSYGTVHGAIETGFREADRIINLYK